MLHKVLYYNNEINVPILWKEYNVNMQIDKFFARQSMQLFNRTLYCAAVMQITSRLLSRMLDRI